MTDQSSAVVAQVYDFAGRRTRREYRAAGVDPTGPPTDFDEFTFDAASRLLTATKGRYSNSVALTYDDGGRLASESLTAFGQTYTVAAGQVGSAGQTSSSGYDAAGRRVSQTFPDGTLLEKTFTSRGQLASLSYAGQSLETRAYDPGRRLVTQTAVLSAAGGGGAGANLVTTRSYRDDGLLAAISRPSVAGTSFTYSWDANKNKTAEVVSDLMSNFGFTVPTGVAGVGAASGETPGATGSESGGSPSGYDANDRLIA